jgi:uncharacterized repeat protein (TIGR02543 family)
MNIGTVRLVRRIFKAALGVVASLCVVPLGVGAQTLSEPLPYVVEDFNGGKPAASAGWDYSSGSVDWQSSGGVNNTGCLKGTAIRGLSAMEVTTPYIAMGAKPMVSFAFAAKNTLSSGVWSDDMVTWEVRVATVEGTTGYYYHDNVDVTNYSGFMSVALDLSKLYCANKTAKVQIRLGINGQVTNASFLDCFLDNVVVRSDAVMFDPGTGGMVSPAYSLVNAEGTLSLSSLPTPTRPDYTFIGWFTEETGGTQVTIGATFSPGDVIYAHWRVNNPTIIYEEFTGTGTPAGWTYSGFSRQTSGGVGGSACIRASYGGTVTIPNVAIGDGGAEMSLYFKVENIQVGIGGGSYYRPKLAISTDGSTWKDVNFTVPPKTDDGNYTANLSSFANQIVSLRISVTDGTNVYIYIDNISIIGAKFTITFDANGGAVSPASGETGTGGKLTSLPKPVRDGYAFIGWFTAETGGTQVTESTSFSANATIYARWTPAYTVIYDANGGDVSTASGMTGAGGKLMSLPTPTRAGYTFNGWFTEETGGTQVTESTAFNSNATIYARWTLITYTVTFNANGGLVTPASGTTGVGRTLASLPTPTRDGYTFNGWFTTSAATGGTQVTESRVFSANTTIYAQWTLITYRVTFNAGGGAVTPASGTTGVGGTLASLPTPTRAGYAFDGWFTAETGGEKVAVNMVYGEDTDIYAQWTRSAYTVTLDADGGSVSPATITIGASGRIASLPTPTRAGYAFDGWFTDVTGGERVTESTVFSGDAEIYARWTPAYTMAFSAGSNGVLTATVDGSPIVSGALLRQGKNVVFTATPDDGYGIDGWTVNGSAVNGNTAMTYTLSSVSAAATVTVYFAEIVSVASPDRVIPIVHPNREAVAVTPVNRLTAELTAGPNPVAALRATPVQFFWQGNRVESAALYVYDASGNPVSKIAVGDKAVAPGDSGRRVVGGWDLRDSKGRVVGYGTYLIKGVIKTAGGKREKVSVAVGVR